MQTNVLYYGDNLDILRRHLPYAAVDLVELDPPFNSNRDYNVIFRDESGNATDAQLLAFEDTWHWGPSAEATLTAGQAERVQPLEKLPQVASDHSPHDRGIHLPVVMGDEVAHADHLAPR